MNIEVEAISSWAFEHGLKLNKNRTQTVVLGHPKFLKKNVGLYNRPLTYSEQPFTTLYSIK